MAALQFFLLSLHDQKDAWERYLRLVRRAGTASYTELCETAGLQVPFNDGSIKAIAQQMSQWHRRASGLIALSGASHPLASCWPLALL